MPTRLSVILRLLGPLALCLQLDCGFWFQEDPPRPGSTDCLRFLETQENELTLDIAALSVFDSCAVVAKDSLALLAGRNSGDLALFRVDCE